MENFTEEDVRREARRQYGKKICIDQLNEAMRQPTLQEAVQVIIMDSEYWDYDPADLMNSSGEIGA